MATTEGQKPIGGSVHWYRELDSTQNELRRLVETTKNPEEGLLVAALHQTAGKGMGENLWEGEPGKNLAFSFYIRPTFLNPDQQFYINIFTSLAVFELIGSIVKPSPVKIKWPNDIYAGNGKIAGILIQHAIRGNLIVHSLVGIGLNINQCQFKNPNAVSIGNLTNREYDLREMLTNLLTHLNRCYTNIQSGKLEASRKAYKNALLGKDQWMQFRYRNNRINARITGISQMGFLQLETDTKTKIECDLKEIEFLF